MDIRIFFAVLMVFGIAVGFWQIWENPTSWVGPNLITLSFICIPTAEVRLLRRRVEQLERLAQQRDDTPAA